MDFLIIAGALLFNILTARVFMPYTLWITKAHCGVSGSLFKKRYKTVARWGVFVAVFGALLIWTAVDTASMFLQVLSPVYNYILTALIVYFFISCGQITGIFKKMKRNLHNEVYMKQLFGYLLVKDSEKLDDAKYQKAFTEVTARLIAEKIVMPALLLFILGNGAVLAYAFINGMAYSDNYTELKAHGYADFAIKLNRALSLPGYFVLSGLLWAVKWIFNLKFKVKSEGFRERCIKQIAGFSSTDRFDRNCIRSARALVYSCTLLLLPIVFSIYIFIQTVLAAIELDMYWDFWNGKK